MSETCRKIFSFFFAYHVFTIHITTQEMEAVESFFCSQNVSLLQNNEFMKFWTF